MSRSDSYSKRSIISFDENASDGIELNSNSPDDGVQKSRPKIPWFWQTELWLSIFLGIKTLLITQN